MATSSDLRPADMSLIGMISLLEELAKPVINDERQEKYCEYITMLLSYFGKERCFLTGSTIEKTRLRLSKDEGDFDYLVVSGIVIPIEYVEYREDIPSFIRIDARKLKLFPKVDNKYLPSSLLSEIQPHAFKHLRDIYQIVRRFSSMRGDNTLSVALNQRIKLGTCLQTYRGITCEDIPTTYRKPERDDDRIRQNVRKCLKDQPTEFNNSAISSIRAIGNLVNGYAKIDNTSNTPSTFQQKFGPIISAFENGENIQQTTENMSPELKRPKRMKSEEVDDIVETASEEATCSSKQNKPDLIGENCMTQNDDPNKSDLIRIHYREKSGKDFIPCFPLSGRPKHMEDWKIRKRTSNWPGQDIIHDIFDSEFFVVAKPAIYKPEKDKDFCLAYNIPEKKLAKAMTRVQKNVLLIIKAIQKSFLAEYCDKITTFHWKTVLYWESECVESLMLQERTEDNILCFLQRVLERMTSALCDGKLVHYFNPTNLFAGKDDDVLLDVAEKVLEIQESPVEILRLFFLEQKDGKLKEEWIPRERIVEFQNHENDHGDSSLVSEVLALLRSFTSEGKETLRTALTDVLTNALPYLIEENTRGKNKDDYDAHSNMIQTALTTIVNQEFLIRDCVSLLLDNVYDQQMNAEEIVKQFEALVMQNIFGNLFR